MVRKKNKWVGWRSFFIILILMVATAAFVYLQALWTEYNNDRKKRETFGIPIPSGYTIHGIDVSHHQGEIQWTRVKQMQVSGMKLDFAFIKATEGLTNVDRMFRRNWHHASKEKVVRGAYHFFLATKSGKKQAENFITQVKLQPGDLPPVLDVEERYGVPVTEVRKRVKEWLTVIEAHYGVKPILYTYVDFYDKVLGKEFEEYPLWAAHYLQPHKPRIQRSWSFWQHSETGKVDGIKELVDFNVFNGDSLQFHSLLIK